MMDLLRRIIGAPRPPPPSAPEGFVNGRYHEPVIHDSQNARALIRGNTDIQKEWARQAVTTQPTGEVTWDMFTGTWRPKGENE